MNLLKLILILLTLFLVSCKSMENRAVKSLYPYESVNKKYPTQDYKYRYVNTVVHGDGKYAVGKLEAKELCVLYLYGNGENSRSLDENGTFEMLYTIGDFLVPDYPNYGLSTGELSEASFVRTATLYYLYLAKECKRTAIWGRSLGASIAALVAAQTYGWHSLVLISPFANLKTLIPELSAFGKLVGDDFYSLHNYDVLAAAKEIDGDVLIVHGAEDDFIKPSHSEKIHEKIKNSKFKKIPGAKHNDIYSFDSARDEILNFLWRPFEL